MVTFRVLSAKELRPRIKVLLELNHQESGVFGKLDPDYPKYEACCDAGLLLSVIAEDDGLCVGYGVFFLTDSIHSGERVAKNNTIYLLPEYRKGGAGTGLIKFCEQEAKNRGAVLMFLELPNTRPMSVLSRRLGYANITQTFKKSL
jgi:GNAT superfamily N-acetyltransferase